MNQTSQQITIHLSRQVKNRLNDNETSGTTYSPNCAERDRKMLRTQKTLVGSKDKVWMMGPKKWDFPNFPKDALHIHFQGPITRQNTQSVINEQLTIKIQKDSLDSFF